MRYPASEKVEIIRTVEQSSLSARRTLEQIGVPRATFYRWYDLYQTGGPGAGGILLETTTCPATSKPRSGRSSTTTTKAAITRASTT